MKIYLLYRGEYSDRFLHSAHTVRDEAVAVSARLQKNVEPWFIELPNIDEVELDEDLCAECGYDASLHTPKHAEAFKHAFVSSRPVSPQSSTP